MSRYISSTLDNHQLHCNKMPFNHKQVMVSCVPTAPPWKVVSVSCLPSEVLTRIFLMLGTPNELFSILLVCRSWYRIGRDDFVWRDMLRDGQYKLTCKSLPTGFESWKDLYRVLELYKEFISLSLGDYITKCCPEIIIQQPLIQQFTPKIRQFLGSNLHQVSPCDVLLHGHEIADKSGYHYHWCYAAYKKSSGIYDFTRYHLALDRKYHTFYKSHVDMMMKGDIVTHNQNQWICWHLSMHFFDTFSVNSIFDMLLAMFMERIVSTEWEVVDPLVENTQDCESCGDDALTSPKKNRRGGESGEDKEREEEVKSGFKKSHGKKPSALQKWAPAYNSKNTFR